MYKVSQPLVVSEEQPVAGEIQLANPSTQELVDPNMVGSDLCVNGSYTRSSYIYWQWRRQ